MGKRTIFSIVLAALVGFTLGGCGIKSRLNKAATDKPPPVKIDDIEINPTDKPSEVNQALEETIQKGMENRARKIAE